MEYVLPMEQLKNNGAIRFIFDLDGTLTSCETLPVIAARFGMGAQIAALTAQVIRGVIPFEEGFRQRVALLSDLDEADVARSIKDVPICVALQDFIAQNSGNCLIASGNYRGWIAPLAARFACPLLCSEGEVNAQNQLHITRILRKETLVREQRKQGRYVVFIGDGHNDAAAMLSADVAIGCALVHEPAPSVISAAHYVIRDCGALLNLLNRLKRDHLGAAAARSSVRPKSVSI